MSEKVGQNGPLKVAESHPRERGEGLLLLDHRPLGL